MRVLTSFHYYKSVDMEAFVAAFPTPPRVFADSGAFSAMNVGAEVSLADYTEWLLRWQHLFEVYVPLDVIGDGAATLANHRAMEDAGLRPIPVYHAGEPWHYLEAYVEAYPYIALGGMVGSAGTPALMRHSVEAYRIARQSGAQFHGFGMTKLELLRALPWYSVDSSSWGAGHRYGQLRLWDPAKARMTANAIGNHAAVYRKAELIRAHGGDPEVLARPGCAMASSGRDTYLAERDMVIACNAGAWVLLEQWLRRRFGDVCLRDGTGDPGPMVYLAEGSPAHLLTAARLLHEAGLST